MNPVPHHPGPAMSVLTDDALCKGGWVGASLGRVCAAPLLAERGEFRTRAMDFCPLPTVPTPSESHKTTSPKRSL